MDEIVIRKAESPGDYRACQEAQRRAWGITEESYIVPIATLVGAQHHGGLVLGAFLPDGRAAGLSFGFLGRSDGRLCLYSQLTGIVPEYQDRGLGGRLKSAQRDFARSQGLDCIAWAFDPLQAGNARFNLEKLGATSRRFVADMYGPRTDALNLGTPTDRLIVEWEVEDRPREAMAMEEALDLPRIVESGGDSAVLVAESILSEPAILLEIPGDIGRLRAEAPDLAARWQESVRQGFLAAFAAGFRAVGFVREGVEGNRRGYYRLRREP